MDCDICAEKITKRRHEIKCQYCELSACVDCCKTYILSLNKPKCMNNSCTGEWSMKFMRDNFTQAFLKTEYRDHQKNVLIEQQLALMPETQLVFEERRRIEDIDAKLYELRSELRTKRDHYRKIEESIIGEYNTKITALNGLKSWHTNYYGNLFVQQVKNAVSAFENQIIEDNGLGATLKTILSQYELIEPLIETNEESLEKFKMNSSGEWESKYRPERDEVVAEYSNKINELLKERGKPARARREFIRKCGDAECRGFLSTRWKCGVCDKTTCSDCHEVVSSDHKCNPDIVATIKLLKTDTRDCPKCQTGIFKIDGCDQMWCTQCKTGFSWTTGKIELKLHNPHYYEWRRQNGGLERDPGDVECGEDINGNLIWDTVRELRRHTKDDELIDNITDLAQQCVHISAYNNRPEIPDYEEYRIMYLRKTLDIEEFKNVLVRTDKAYAKKNELYTVYHLLTVTCADIIRRFKESVATSELDKYDRTILNEINTIVNYVNGCFAEIGYTYSCISKHVIGYDLIVNKIALKGHKTVAN